MFLSLNVEFDKSGIFGTVSGYAGFCLWYIDVVDQVERY
jgi:hypothetical protein